MVRGWQRQTIGELVRIASGQVDPKDNAVGQKLSVGPDCLRTGGGIEKHKLQTANDLRQISGKYTFDRDAILYAKIRPNLNKVGLPDFDGICSADVYPIWIKDADATDRTFVYFLLTSDSFVADASSRSFRTGLPKINRPDLESILVLLPPLPEQRKIAAILRTWDEAIEKLEALRAAKQKRLDGLTHALIFGKLGMNGQRRNWQSTRLSEVTFELTARNTNLAMGYAAVMGVTKARGIVPMREQTIGGDLSRYKRLPPRAFAYNPMRINVGSIAMNDRDEEVLVSPDYVVFSCTENGLAPDFLNHLRKTHWWSHHINIGGSGSVRMRTYYADLAAMKLPLPAYEEQLEIVAVLNTAQDDVRATEKASKVLTRQKRGLMQKLLTGEWRVNTTNFCHAELRRRK